MDDKYPSDPSLGYPVAPTGRKGGWRWLNTRTIESHFLSWSVRELLFDLLLQKGLNQDVAETVYWGDEFSETCKTFKFEPRRRWSSGMLWDLCTDKRTASVRINLAFASFACLPQKKLKKIFENLNLLVRFSSEKDLFFVQ